MALSIGSFSDVGSTLRVLILSRKESSVAQSCMHLSVKNASRLSVSQLNTLANQAKLYVRSPEQGLSRRLYPAKLDFESRDYERNIFVGNVQGHRLHDICPGICGSVNA